MMKRVAELEQLKAQQARELLIQVCELHAASCTDAGCVRKGNLLAWIAHCIGATAQDLRAMPGLIVEYDLRCKREGGCDSHRKTTEPRKES